MLEQLIVAIGATGAEWQVPGLRKAGYSKERRVDPQVVVDCWSTDAGTVEDVEDVETIDMGSDRR
ncbi:hypothetical protein LRP67_20410 [Nocardioides sp. cx-169]|uniref:hypothetical protein n=1 Tax=Nocardioides sp. cx-169 TaxID=2899080 RepID=UPI001E356263|nr:hypothetical protein [Nocardioides sp. cx-169]MCD4536463.1 hypothetical protein [Nocardioides sp. cx-169]